MNQEYFEYIAFEMDKTLEKEAEKILSTKKYTDVGEELLRDHYPVVVESDEEAVTIATRLIDVFKNIIKRNDDFNTNMLAFVSLYNYLKIKQIFGKIKLEIIESISDVLKRKWEKAFFSDLLMAMNSLEEDDFIKLKDINPSLEITYMYLAVIYMQKILDCRIRESKEDYDALICCISKISGELRYALFYEYRYKNFVDECTRTGHYQVYLPQLDDGELINLNLVYSVYEARNNKNMDIKDYLHFKQLFESQSDESISLENLMPDTCNDVLCLNNHYTVVNYGDFYDIIIKFLFKAGNYMGELEKKYSELKVLQDERYRLIRDFSHTYENMQAVGLKEIANILMDSDDYQIKQCGRVILAEYGMKDSLKAEVNLLRLNFENKRDDITQLIRKGVSYDENDSSINVNSIFEEALKICLLRVIYSGNPRGEDQIAKGMYKRIKARVGSMKGFVQNFENRVILNGIGVQFFLNDMGINIDFCSDDEWNKLFFEKNKHAEVLIRSIFAELITNSFKYANLNDTIFYSLKLSNGIYVLQQTNTFTELTVSESGVGLESKGEILKKINGYESCGVEKILNEYEGGRFTAFFLMDGKLFNVQEDIGNV